VSFLVFLCVNIDLRLGSVNEQVGVNRRHNELLGPLEKTMKNRKNITLTAVLFSALALSAGQSAFAGSYITQAAKMCKSEANTKYGSEESPVRLKFKGAMGSQVSPTIVLQVIARDADSFKVVCDVNGRNWQVVSLERQDALDSIRIVGARDNIVAP